MPTTAKGTPYVVSTDLVANYPTVSSDLADHIDDKLAYNAVTINAQTGSGANAYTFALADASEGKLVTASNAAAATYTVPPQSSVTWANGAVLRVLNQGAGVVTLAGGAGVTLNGTVLTLNQYQYAEIYRTASNSWTVVGIATPPGLVKITDSTFSGVSSVSINNCFSSTYQNYRIMVVSTQSTSAFTLMRMRSSGVDATGNNYEYQYVAGGASVASASSGTATGGYLFAATATLFALAIDVYRPGEAVNTLITSTFRQVQINAGIMATEHQVATAYDGFTLYTSAGTITGSVYVYGYRN